MALAAWFRLSVAVGYRRWFAVHPAANEQGAHGVDGRVELAVQEAGRGGGAGWHKRARTTLRTNANFTSRLARTHNAHEPKPTPNSQAADHGMTAKILAMKASS